MKKEEICECQSNPLARVTLAPGLSSLLVNRALGKQITLSTHRDLSSEQYYPLFELLGPDLKLETKAFKDKRTVSQGEIILKLEKIILHRQKQLNEG